MDFTEKTLSREVIYEGRIIRVYRDRALIPGGKEALREVVEHPGGVCIAAVDDERRVYLVEQYRYPMEENTVELPAGKLEWGEEPYLAAVRELKEETGCTAEKIDYVGVMYPSPGFSAEKLYMYIATGLKKGEQALDEDEYLTLSLLPLKEAAERALAGEFKDGKTALLLLAADRLVE
ncbi:MAG: NUDIX hydrolase [Oscillospiraceae bacterium]|nr:NUDIX hydrolase [Oscillospiraceae bacterium]